tara:strand:- start:539 stop:943 length:405 start_codon:yes stop_codon:yes gene_type:complete
MITGYPMTLERYVNPNKTFIRWNELFYKATNRGAIEVIIDEGALGTIALFIFDGKDYWTPNRAYEENAVMNQFMIRTGREPKLVEETNLYEELDEYDFDADLWQETMADAIEDNHEQESIEHWDNYGPKLPYLL